jgi:hypothetical protein
LLGKLRRKKTSGEDIIQETADRYRKDYSKSELLGGNLAIILWIGLGALSCALFFPLAGVAFFGLAAFLIFYELGKHGCVTCYYCKTCTIGMGKLPELFFRQAGTANVNARALKLFPFVYLILSALPASLIVISFFQEMTYYKVALLALVLAFSAYAGIIRRQTLLRPSAEKNVATSQ